MVGDKEKAIEMGCSAYLSKPCLPEDIVKEVKSFLTDVP
jgi:CheY-like chemotaxis protein